MSLLTVISVIVMPVSPAAAEPGASGVHGQTALLGQQSRYGTISDPILSGDGTTVAITDGSIFGGTHFDLIDTGTGFVTRVDYGSQNHFATRPDVSTDAQVVVFGITPALGAAEGTRSDVVLWRKGGDFVNLTSTADGKSEGPRVSSDGNRILFLSEATNMTVGDANGRADLFLMDREARTMVNVTHSLAHVVGEYAFSGDGTAVVFETSVDWASGRSDIALWRDGVVENLTLQGNDGSWQPALSDDGNKIVFVSRATNLTADPANSFMNVFEFNRASGAVQNLTLTADADSSSPLISGNGEVRVFSSAASNLTSEFNSGNDVFRFDSSGQFSNLTKSETATATSISTDGEALGLHGLRDPVNYLNPIYDAMFFWRRTSAAGDDTPPRLVDVTFHNHIALVGGTFGDEQSGRNRVDVVVLASDDPEFVVGQQIQPIYWGPHFYVSLNPPYDQNVVLGLRGFDNAGNQYPADGSWLEFDPDQRTMADASTIEELLASPDYDSATHGAVLRLYRAFFNREPDIGGAKYWIDLNERDYTLDQIAEFFTLSEEFSNNYSETTGGEYLAAVYQNVLGRTYDQAGFDYWLGLLESGQLNRGGVVRWIAANAEFINRYPYSPS